jgi:cation/acetate symporter
LGYDGSVYLMGWTGGYVLLAVLLAPYLRKFGKFTVPDFIGDRYESKVGRRVAVFCAIFICFTYVAGQMRGVGVVFSRFLEVSVEKGVLIGMAIVFIYAVLGGMKGITWTQVAQYCILIFAFLVPAIFISIQLTGNPIPQVGFGSRLDGVVGQEIASGAPWLLETLNQLHDELGFKPYTDGSKSLIDVTCITLALMVGTAGLPHVIVRFYTVPRVKDARTSAFWALFFIAILYTAAPAVAAFARANLIHTVDGARYAPATGVNDQGKSLPDWFHKWEETGLIAWIDKNRDGRVRYRAGAAFGAFEGSNKPAFSDKRGANGERMVFNPPNDGPNELYVDRDIMVLANPEIAGLPAWVIGLVAAGALAAALSTAAGLLLVVSTAISHDLLKRGAMPNISERGELMAARIAAAVAVVIAGIMGIYPPGFVAQVVAFAFGLAASSFFPAIVMGIFSKRMNQLGAVSGMVAGIAFTASYIVWFKFIDTAPDAPSRWWFGISPEGIGSVGMLVNFAVALGLRPFGAPPSAATQELVEHIRVPEG